MDTHTLTYAAKVDPPAGTVMGPGMDGRTWKVLGSVFDAEAGTTEVTFEAVTS